MADGSLTADARAGREVFRASGCATCHGGVAFTDSASGAMHDIGTLRPSSGPQTALDTPTLRGLWETGPYLHDGSRTLEGAVLAHRGVALPAPRLAELLAYLNQIDDDEISAPSNHPPVFVTLALKRLLVGEPRTQMITVSDPDGDPVTVTASGLPPGIAWHADTLTATGTPAPGSAGVYTVTFQASDGVATVPGVYQWTVKVPQCSNGIDDDLDGAKDHPADPQCDSPIDDRESPGPACGLGFEVMFVVGPVMALRRRRAAKPKA
jgi:hypothetical protein